MDTLKKFSPVPSLLITDKSSLLVPTEKSFYGTTSDKKNTNLKTKTTKIGSLVSDIPPKLNPKKEVNNPPISPLSDGTEDWKSGTPTSKLNIPSKPTKLTSTLYLFLLMENMLLQEVKIKNYTFGILKTYKLTPENSMPDPLSSKLPSTPNYNGFLLPLNKVLKFGI